MLELDGTPNKSHLGANAILAVSLAVARAAAEDAGLPLYRYLGGPLAHVLPVPMMNILNGGAHASNTVDFQEFMVVPVGAETFRRSAAHGRRGVPRAEEGARQARALDGGGRRGRLRARTCRTTKRRSKRSWRRSRSAGYEAGKDVAIALDVAASELYAGRQPTSSRRAAAARRTADDMIALYKTWIDRYPIVSIEDGLAEDDWDGWARLTEALGSAGAARRRRPVLHQRRAPGARASRRASRTRSSSR